MTERRFNDDRVRDFIRRATELDCQDADSISESQLRGIATELGVGMASLERALKELEGELRANPPPRPGGPRRWAPFVAILVLACLGLIVEPQASRDLAIPLVILLLLAGLSAAATSYIWRQRESMVLGLEAVRYMTAKGERHMPWTSVLELKSDLPGTLQLIGPSGSIMLRLQDFGDPDAVLAAIRLRIARASGLQSPQ